MCVCWYGGTSTQWSQGTGDDKFTGSRGFAVSRFFSTYSATSGAESMVRSSHRGSLNRGSTASPPSPAPNTLCWYVTVVLIVCTGNGIFYATAEGTQILQSFARRFYTYTDRFLLKLWVIRSLRLLGGGGRGIMILRSCKNFTTVSSDTGQMAQIMLSTGWITLLLKARDAYSYYSIPSYSSIHQSSEHDCGR